MSFPLIVLSCFILSMMAVYFYKGFIIRRGLNEMPNERSSHAVPTPGGGGLAFMTVLILFLGYQGFDIYILGAIAAFTLMGALDDFLDLGSKTKLLLQLVLCGGVIGYLTSTSTLVSLSWLTEYISIPILAFILTLALVWFVNLYNFMDGTDGLSAGQTLFLCFGLLMFSDIVGLIFAPYMILTAAAVLGFFMLNFPPAKIFMGDSGSLPLGFFIGLMLIFTALNSVEGLLIALILPLYYLADSGMTLVKRLRRKENIFAAHREHYYQMITNSDKKTHKTALYKIMVCNIGLFLCCYLLGYNLFLGAFMAIIIVIFTLRLFSRHRLK